MKVPKADRPRRLVLLLPVLALACLSGCERKLGGQIVATVNGREITQRELAAEIDAAALAASRNRAEVLRDALDKIIDRNLLADYARDQGLDRDPEYLIRRRELEESLLAAVAVRKIVGPTSVATPAEVQRFIRDNPYMFGDRQKLSLDQIQFPTPATGPSVGKYLRLGNLDAVAAALTRDAIPFTRAPTTLDTGAIPTELSRAILRLAPGELFNLTAGGTTYIGVVNGKVAAALPQDRWTGPAGAAAGQAKAEAQTAAALDRLRRGADIKRDPQLGQLAERVPARKP